MSKPKLEPCKKLRIENGVVSCTVQRYKDPTCNKGMGKAYEPSIKCLHAGKVRP